MPRSSANATDGQVAGRKSAASPRASAPSKPMSTPVASRSIRADEVMSLREAARRLGWKAHSIRQAKRRGLRVVKFGSTNYVLGESILEFFRQLADAGENGDQTPKRRES